MHIPDVSLNRKAMFVKGNKCVCYVITAAFKRHAGFKITFKFMKCVRSIE